MEEKKLRDELLKLLNEFIDENEIELDFEIDENSRLIGSSSVFDSMELIQFLVEVENLLEEDYDLEIELTSEKAMSRRNSPFLSTKALSDYIINQ